MKKRVVTGDRPTGKLHLGHYVGSLQKRVELQDEYDCFFLIADLHTLTTKPKKSEILEMRSHITDVVVDWLSVGIDPNKATIYLQSALPELFEMNLFFGMLVSLSRLSGLPSIKEMARNAHMEEIPFGLVGYPVLQSADILLFRSHLVPVGKDNEAHIELARDIARRFNQYYGEIFPLPELLLSETTSLIGIDGKGKMSKSAGNAIYLSDDEKSVAKKVRSMFTDPDRVHAHIPGRVEGNPLFIFHKIFNPDQAEIADFTQRYQEGKVSDVEVKESLVRHLNHFLNPIRARREEIAQQKGLVEKVIYEGTLRAQEMAKETIKMMRSEMGVMGTWQKISRIARS